MMKTSMRVWFCQGFHVRLYVVSGCFWLLYPQQFLYYEPDIGGYYVKGPTLQLLVQLLN